MTAKAYYLTTLGDWQRYAARFANSHWLPLAEAAAVSRPAPNPADSSPQVTATRLHSASSILVLVEADEGVHLALEDDPSFEALPHPLAQQPLSEAAQAALAALGVTPGATTFDAAEAAARVHPLLRHRVF